MTALGYAILEDEIKRRLQIGRPHSIKRIRQTVDDDANLAENTEYHSAKAEQAANEARIAELENQLAHAEVIDVSKLAGDTIRFGATVMLLDEDTDQKKNWQIVGEPEADVTKGKISIMSPLARALIGKTYGDTIELEVPSGSKAFTVQKIEWQG